MQSPSPARLQAIQREFERVKAGHRQKPTGKGPADEWQFWREEGGLWTPDGWLRPGWFADPPAFEPVSGERLRTPGFEAADFRHSPRTTDHSPVDVLIPLGTGSRHGDAELRYALRSIERHVEGLGRVWIVGHRPGWVRGVEHIPAGDPKRSKDRNILAKLLAACEAGVSERFLFWSDDQVLLRPLAFGQFGPYHHGDLAARATVGKRWHQRLLGTRDWLQRQGYTAWHGDTHTPIPIQREKLLELAELCREDWQQDDGFTIGSWYVGAAEMSPTPMGPRKATVEAALPADRLRAAIAGRWFLGFNDAGFTPELRGLIEELFPEKCRFEAAGSGRRAADRTAYSRGLCPGTGSGKITVRPAGPTLSVIVPTLGRPTLRRTLERIGQQQLVDGDEVLVVQDGPADESVRRVFEASGLPGKYLGLDRHYGDYGGTPRNHGMKHACGEYLAFMDDDDTYRPGAFDAIRRAATRRPGRPLMFRLYCPSHKKHLWQDKTVRPSNVATSIFVLPNTPARLGQWGTHRGSDFAFVYTTLQRWPEGSLAWCPEIVTSYLESGFTHEHVLAARLRRNLLYHIYPVASNEEWRLNVEKLLTYWDRFNGRKVVGIVCDDRTEPVETVQAAFPDDGIEWIVRPNDPQLGEAVTFREGVGRLRSLDAFEATFYAHAKGVMNLCAGRSRVPDNRRHLVVPSVRHWRNLMYDHCLGDLVAVDKMLKFNPCAGCFKYEGDTGRHEDANCVRAYWHFAGTFFWFNHAHYFGHHNPVPLRTNRWGVEYHLGTMFADEDAHCFLPYPRKFRGRFYDMTEEQWQEAIQSPPRT